MSKEKKYWTRSHTKHRMTYHIVWIPKYRKRGLEGAIAERLEELIEECAEVNGREIKELNIQKDHVHMLIQLKPRMAMSEVIQLMKGKGSFILRKEFPKLKEFF